MVDSDLLKLLCCPETLQPVQPAEPALLERLNQKIVAGVCLNRSGRTVSEKVTGGLVRGDGKMFYPIRNDIPVMFVEEGIPLD